MEPQLEGFDPQQHRLLEDNKSWVLKSVPTLDLTPTEVKFQYNEFVDKVTAANPELTPQEAIEKVWEVEKKYDHSFFNIRYPEDPNRKLVTERNRLSALAELKLASEEEQIELERLKTAFQSVVQKVMEQTGDKQETIQDDIDSVLLCGIAKDLLEAKNIMTEGPIIQGFEETVDPKIPNEKVKKFLKDTFGAVAVRRARVGRITKSDKYLIYRGHSAKDTEEGNELSQKGIAMWGDGGMLEAEDKEHYLRAAMFLEKTNNLDELKHLYKIRATAGNSGGFHQIQLHSFGIEKSTDFDYLTDVSLSSEEDKMRAYILGTAAHEVAHRYEDQINESVFAPYKKIMEEESTPNRKKFVSDYVVRHEQVYGSDPALLFDEDFAEAVRIYVTNSSYLQTNYPQRFNFIRENFPFIKADGVIDVIIKE